MTQQPNYPPPPPGAYPPQYQQPAGPPPGYGTPPAATPQYQQPAGPPPAQQWPAPAGVPQGVPEPGAPAVPGGDGFGDPGQGQGGDGDSPALHQLEGRLLLWRPKPAGIIMGQPYDKTKPLEEQAFVDVIVCDGPPVGFNLNGETGAQTPFASGPKVAPFFIGNMRINKVILDKLRDDYINNPNPAATCLARFVKTPPRGAGKPYNDLAPASEADKALARPIYAAWDQIKAASTVAAPDQFAGPAAPQYGTPPAAAPQYQQPAPAGPPPGYGQQPAPQQWAPQPQAAPAPYGQGYPPPPY